MNHVLLPNAPEDSFILEIGPGAGRWTEHLLTRAQIVLGGFGPKMYRTFPAEVS